MYTELNRRDVLKTIGGAGLAAVFGARALDFLGDDAQAATTCLLTPEVTEGPYWVDTSLTRRDVRSGKPGLPLVLRFTLLNAKTIRIEPALSIPRKLIDEVLGHLDDTLKSLA